MYSIGYQGRDTGELVDILRQRGVTVLLDVRSRPYSRHRKYVEFNKNRLGAHLAEAGIGYEWNPGLGGFSRIREEEILKLANRKGERVCLMCMERDPDKCHRKYEIGRRLEAYGVGVEHL